MLVEYIKIGIPTSTILLVGADVKNKLSDLSIHGKYNIPFDFSYNMKLKKLFLSLWTKETYEHSIDLSSDTKLDTICLNFYSDYRYNGHSGLPRNTNLTELALFFESKYDYRIVLSKYVHLTKHSSQIVAEGYFQSIDYQIIKN